MTIFTIARTTFGEAIRKKVLMTFFGVTVAMIPVSMMFGFFEFRQELTTIKAFGLGLIGIAGLLISLIMGIQLVPQEIERRTIYTILSKPVNRYEFLLGKFLGAVYTLFVSILLMGIVFIFAVTVKNYAEEVSKAQGLGQIIVGIGHIIAKIPSMTVALGPGVVLIFFQLIMVVAMTVFFSTFLGTWINFFATSGLYVVGSLSSVTASLWRDTKKPPLTKAVGWLINHLVPQFGNFQVLNPIIEPHFQAPDFTKYILTAIIYSLFVCVMMMAFGIWFFEKKEV